MFRRRRCRSSTSGFYSDNFHCYLRLFDRCVVSNRTKKIKIKQKHIHSLLKNTWAKAVGVSPSFAYSNVSICASLFDIVHIYLRVLFSMKETQSPPHRSIEKRVFTFRVVAWAQVEVVAVFPFPRDTRRWVASRFARQLERLVLTDTQLARCPLVDNIRRFSHIEIRHLCDSQRQNKRYHRLSTSVSVNRFIWTLSTRRPMEDKPIIDHSSTNLMISIICWLLLVD